jgi:hypothetical protein
MGLLDDIKPMLAQAVSVSEDFIDAIDLRLQSLGYTLQDNDPWLVSFMAQKVAKEILTKCNLSEIPKGLEEIAIDMICGEFLLNKKGSGQLAGFEADINAALLKQTESGDTSVTFAVEATTSPEQRLDLVIAHLINYGKTEFANFRKLRWT